MTGVGGRIVASRKSCAVSGRSEPGSSVFGMFLVTKLGLTVTMSCCWLLVGGKPFLPSRSGEQSKAWDFDDNVQNYLMEFGYLPKSNIETGNLRTMEQLQEAVRLFQSFANLDPTGEINRETLELMRKPRCGAPDLPNSLDFMPTNTLSPLRFHHRRHRRFVIQGQKWEHPIVTWR